MNDEEKKLPDVSEDELKPKGGGKRHRAALILLLLALAAATLGIRWWVDSKANVATDDAFVDGHVYNISARITGHVKSVLVEDNQHVTKGEVIVKLDPADYQSKVADASAALDMAKNDTSSDYAQLGSVKAALSRAQANKELADRDTSRGEELYRRGIISKSDMDKLKTASEVAAAQLKEASEAVRKAVALFGISVKGGSEAKVAQKKAELVAARLNLSYVDIYAPSDGFITRKSVEPGNNVQPGQPLMALVQLGETWITANYKESQLTYVRPGQKVELVVDAYPGHKFSGRVESIMAGTGAAFSLLPPENATGNYVKVVQRVPVKITIDGTSDPGHVLRVGMSVVPTIITGLKARDVLRDINPF